MLLIDGSAFLYRSFYALPPMTTAQGQQTNAIKGTLNILLKLRKDFSQRTHIVVFDAPGKTFRDAWFPEYKANRKKMPAELREQIEPLQKIITAMGFPSVVLPGVEADDVIATLARESASKGEDVLIVSNDKDLAQLVTDKIHLYDAHKHKTIDEEGVVQKYGVHPDQVIDYLSLVGDSSDNIPGVPGIGHKTAGILLAHFGHLDNLYAQLDSLVQLKIRGAKKIADGLKRARETAYLAQKLVTLKTDVNMSTYTDRLQHTPPDDAQLLRLYQELEFRSLAQIQQRVLDQAHHTPATGAADAPEKARHTTISSDYELIVTENDLQRWVQCMVQAEYYAIETATTSQHYMDADLIGLSLAVSGSAAYIPFGHREETPQLSKEGVLATLKPILEAEQPKLVGHNLKFACNILANYGIHLRGIVDDPLLASFILDPGSGRHDLPSLAFRHLQRSHDNLSTVLGKTHNWSEVPLARAAPYMAANANAALQLSTLLAPHIVKIPSLEEVYRTIDLPLIPVLSRIERAGCKIDVSMLNTLSRQLGDSLSEIENHIWDISEEKFNINSPKQLQAILFDKFQLHSGRKTPTKQRSVNEAVLQQLSLHHPLPKLVLQHRMLNKLKNTYADPLPKQVSPHTGKIHTSYHQAGASTGRLSSSDPNLQNIPIRTEEGRKIRRAFCAEEGFIFIDADYSQIELRIMAHLSQDEGLCHAFCAGDDIHSTIAGEIFSCPVSNVTADQRRAAKAINFGLIYGMSAFGLARQINVDVKDAQEYMDFYFHRYAGVHTFMEEKRQQVRAHGYVETIFHRRLYLPNIKSAKHSLRAGAERAAINAPMQGSSADIIKRAMIAIDRQLRENQLNACIIMQVHDELVVECANCAQNEVTDIVRQEMVDAADLRVPLVVDIGSGDNWDDAH